MADQAARRERWVLAAMALVALVVVGTLTWGVWRQFHRLRELAAVEAELLPLVDHERERKERLLEALNHVSSPGYVEEWARVHAGMARPGEVRLIVPSLQETPNTSSTPVHAVQSDTQRSSSRPFWEALWQRLFGEG